MKEFIAIKYQDFGYKKLFVCLKVLKEVLCLNKKISGEGAVYIASAVLLIRSFHRNIYLNPGKNVLIRTYLEIILPSSEKERLRLRLRSTSTHHSFSNFSYFTVDLPKACAVLA